VPAAGKACVGVWEVIVETSAHNKPGNSVEAFALRVGGGTRSG
jgi:hypothetical protein